MGLYQFPLLSLPPSPLPPSFFFFFFSKAHHDKCGTAVSVARASAEESHLRREISVVCLWTVYKMVLLKKKKKKSTHAPSIYIDFFFLIFLFFFFV
jgi:hypothetical protein